ncbi:MAG: GNAT family N-acetyltransferase [Clostridiales bacterium]|jgi:diamine N-acetyltransferase|nr:GNAT family N-acetyltransferase [Clostridiales bacterium]
MIEFREITFENLGELTELEVADGQKNFLADNLHSLAHAYISITTGCGYATPYAIYAGGAMVGFIMYDYQPKDPSYYIWRLMIDKNHQGKGYGRAAIEKLIAEIKTRPHGPADCIEVFVVAENVAAIKLYDSIGFVDTGVVDEGEMLLRLGI